MLLHSVHLCLILSFKFPSMYQSTIKYSSSCCRLSSFIRLMNTSPRSRHVFVSFVFLSFCTIAIPSRIMTFPVSVLSSRRDSSSEPDLSYSCGCFDFIRFSTACITFALSVQCNNLSSELNIDLGTTENLYFPSKAGKSISSLILLAMMNRVIKSFNSFSWMILSFNFVSMVLEEDLNVKRFLLDIFSQILLSPASRSVENVGNIASLSLSISSTSSSDLSGRTASVTRFKTLSLSSKLTENLSNVSLSLRTFSASASLADPLS